MTKSRIKRTCDGCKAISHLGCELGYRVSKEYLRPGIFNCYVYRPAEVCPKPKTNEEYSAYYTAIKADVISKFGSSAGSQEEF